MIPLVSEGANLTNASASLSGGMGDMAPLLIVVGIVAVIAAVAIASTTVYRWLLHATGYFARSVEYALKGVVTAVFAAVFVAPLYLFTQLDAGTKALFAKALVVVMLTYAALVVLGLVGDSVWGAIKRRHVEATGHKPLEGVFSGDDDD